MPRQFHTGKDRKFMDGIRTEIDNDLVRQHCLYYRINVKKSKVDEVYGEITKKVFDDPVGFYCRILWEEPEVIYRGATKDTIYRIECRVNTKELEDRGIVAKDGDVIEHNQEFYEIEKAVLTQPELGQQDSKIEVRINCRSCRENYFDAPTHPIKEPKDRYSGTMNPDIPTVENYVGNGRELIFPDGD
jgi:hypothetical protein